MTHLFVSKPSEFWGKNLEEIKGEGEGGHCGKDFIIIFNILLTFVLVEDCLFRKDIVETTVVQERVSWAQTQNRNKK